MIHKFPGWDKAPKGATHFSVQDVGSPWLKVEDGHLYFWFFAQWRPYKEKAKHHRHMKGAIVRPKEQVVIDKEEDKLTLEAFKKTKAYQQIKNFIAKNNGTPAQQGVLVKEAMRAYEKDKDKEHDWHKKTWAKVFKIDDTLNGMFKWAGTKRTVAWWSMIDNALKVKNLVEFLATKDGVAQPVKIVADIPVPPPIPAVPAVEVKAEAPKPVKVGWWE